MADLPELGPIRSYIPVPEVFHSFMDKKPFSKCLVCTNFLLDDGTRYLVERAFVGAEPIYEYAMCLECYFQLQEELSAESLQRIDAHIEERVLLADRRNDLLKVSVSDVEPWIEECVLTKKKRKQCRGHVIYAQCDGTHLLFTYLPYMISVEGIDELIPLLSKKTRDRLDDFIEEFLGMPPEFRASPDMPPLVFL